MSKKRVLIIDDDQSLRRIIEYNLTEAGYETGVASSGEEGLKMFRQGRFDMAITDLRMKKIDGMEVLKRIKQISEKTIVIIITAYATVERAVEAMKSGCYDYLIKPFSRDELILTIKKAFKVMELENENIKLKRELDDRFKRENIIGVSKEMQKVFDVVSKVARSDARVLITGESGTGKELIARSIYHNSLRKDAPFITINCAAIPDNLVESELFGYVKGAFSGANNDKPGKFELADGGTLFLDEITQLKPDIQAKLLRVLQEKEFDKLGSTATQTVDVRILSATNAKIDELIQSGAFREDLYYRINVINIKLPPLRERPEDIPHLIKFFLKKLGRATVKFDAAVLTLLKNYRWPGNVRELNSLIESLVLLAEDNSITVELLPERFHKGSTTFGKVRFEIDGGGINLEEVEKELITYALNKFNGNRSRAAKFLGISRPTLLYRLDKYGIN